MKGFSLTQPWATLMAIRAKRIETRSWSTTYRGPIAIHAAKGFPRDCQELCYEPPFRDVLIAAGFDEPVDLPRGSILAVGRVMSCAPTERIVLDRNIPEQAHEYAFGDYADGRFGWFIQGVKALKEPIPCKGALGLWTIPPAVLKLLP